MQNKNDHLQKHYPCCEHIDAGFAAFALADLDGQGYGCPVHLVCGSTHHVTLPSALTSKPSSSRIATIWL